MTQSIRVLLSVLIGFLFVLFGKAPSEAVDADKVFDATVTVETRGSTGAGVFISSRRLLTAAHVLGSSTQVQISRNQPSEFDSIADVIHVNKQLDIAVLESREISKVFLSFRETSIEKGDVLYTAGSPIGDTVLSRGIYLGTQWVDAHQLGSAKIAVDNGNSGGPVIDENQSLIGILLSVSTVKEETYFAELTQIQVVLSEADGYPNFNGAKSRVLSDTEDNNLFPPIIVATLIGVVLSSIYLSKLRKDQAVIKIRVEE